MTMIRKIVFGFVLFAASVNFQSFAQDTDAILERAEKINKFLSLLQHDDPSIRLAAMEQGMNSNDHVLRDRAVEAGLVSSDPQIANMAITQYLSSRPVMILELPSGLNLTAKQEDWAANQLPAQLQRRKTNNGRWNSSDFLSDIDFHKGGSWNIDCNITGGRYLCQAGKIAVLLKPSEGGVFSGLIKWDDSGDIPIISSFQ